MIRLSVIIPVYNVEDYVAKCLDSLISPAAEALSRGEKPDYEIIAVNDGSTDSSPAIVQDYVNRYPQFIRLITTENMGQGHARNVGIDEAQGEYLYFIDSDDYLAPDAMSELLNALDGDYDILIFDSIAVNTDGLELEYRKGCARNDDLKLSHYPELLLQSPDVWNKIFRRSLYIESGVRFTERVWFEDLRTVPKLYHYTDRIVYLPKAWHRYVQRPGSVTNTRKIERNLEIIPAVDELIAFYKSTAGYPEIKDALEYLAFHSEFLTSSVRANLADWHSDVQDKLREDFLGKFPNYASNPYVRTMSRKHKLLTTLLMHRQYLAVHIIMKLNNRLKVKKV